MLKKYLLTFLFLIFTSSISLAENEFYLGLDFGLSKLRDRGNLIENELMISNKLFATSKVENDKSILDKRIFGGYNFSKIFGVEIGFTHSYDTNIHANGMKKNNENYSYNGNISYTISNKKSIT